MHKGRAYARPCEYHGRKWQKGEGKREASADVRGKKDKRAKYAALEPGWQAVACSGFCCKHLQIGAPCLSPPTPAACLWSFARASWPAPPPGPNPRACSRTW